MTNRILVVDDDDGILKSVKIYLKGIDCRVDTLNCPNTAKKVLHENFSRYKLVLIDHQFKNAKPSTGDQLASFVKKNSPQTPVVMMSGDRSEKTLRSWLKVGVDNFIYKPIVKEQLTALTKHAIEQSCEVQSQDENLKLFNIQGCSQSLISAVNNAYKYAHSNLPVLIMGETGTGKELIARGIHKNSSRASKRFIAINCSSFKDDTALLESELFGHEKGSFTGAINQKKGILEEAQGGTLLLDEIHHLSPSAQAKLLRAIQEKVIRRVGGSFEIPYDVRIICTSRPFLKEYCQKGSFLPDLYFRIATLDLTIPPLRERKEDILPLCMAFILEIEKRDQIYKHLSKDFIRALENYSWPGNVRELLNLIEKLFVVVDEKSISEHHFPYCSENKNVATESFTSFQSLKLHYEKQRNELLLKALIQSNHNISKTAELLGEKRSTLNSLLRKMNLLHLSNTKREEVLKGL